MLILLLILLLLSNAFLPFFSWATWFFFLVILYAGLTF